MVKYQIQAINGEIVHDFAFGLLRAIEFQNWARSERVYAYDTVIAPYYNDRVVPVGSVEFCNDYFIGTFGENPPPINIPVELLEFKFTNRIVINGTEKDLSKGVFFKSNDAIKSITDIYDDSMDVPEGNYQISETIDIESEYRCFVYDGELVGIHHYSGSFYKYPNIEEIKSMIKAYSSQPISYTLDVGIYRDETVIIEVHDFFSCGLYGFANYKILPQMFTRWFNNYKACCETKSI